MPQPASPPSGRPSQRRLQRRPLAGVNDVLDDKYRLLRPLKRGSMGAVFAAENQRLGVPVAVKVIRADVQASARAELAKRIILEANVAFRVDHPAIVRVLDVGATGQGDPYIVMELLRGETLAAALTEHGQVSPTQAVRVLLPIVHALVTAHACEVIHRDIKPHNIFLARTSDGRIQPKLIDFGLAKAPQPTNARITQVGNTMGSPAYMAPEQVRGEEVTEQADLWSFCVMLYELIAGAQPFQANALEVLFTCILFDPPIPLPDQDDQARKDLWQILSKGLKKDLEQRWGSMRELGAALAEWLLEQGYSDDICYGSVQSMWLGSSDGVRRRGPLDSLPVPMTRRLPAEGDSPSSAAGRRSSTGGASPSGPGRRLPANVDSASSEELTVTKTLPEKRAHRRWLYTMLWVLVLTGIAGAVTGYLGIPIPGIPESWTLTWP